MTPPTVQHIAIHDLGGTGPVLLIAHATGYHGRAYRAMAEAIGDRFHAIALDIRGHGDTPMPEGAPVSWPGSADDIQTVAGWLRERHGPVAAFGHSMGGGCLLIAASRDPDLFTALALYEPIVFPTRNGPRDPDAPPSAMAAAARRRRREFPSFEEAIAVYGSKPPMNSFRPEVIEDYVRHGFVEEPDGSVRLKCEPHLESTTFEVAGDHDAWDHLPSVTVPVLLLSGRQTGNPGSRMSDGIAARLPAGELRRLEHLDHFGPMTAPEEVAGLVAGWLERHRPGTPDRRAPLP